MKSETRLSISDFPPSVQLEAFTLSPVLATIAAPNEIGVSQSLIHSSIPFNFVVGESLLLKLSQAAT
jgi:hypothetical protein